MITPWAPLAGAAVGVVVSPLLALVARGTSARDRPGTSGRRVLVCLAAVTGSAASTWSPALLAAAIPLMVLGLPAAVVDLYEHRLPNVLTIPLAVLGPVGLGIAAVVTGQYESGLRSAAGAVTYGGFLLVQFVVSPSTGPGDVKYAVGLGAYLGWVGWSWLLAGMLAGYLVTLLALGLHAAVTWRLVRGPVPLGPGMYGGTLLALTAAALLG